MAKEVEKRCGTCANYQAPLNKAGRRQIHRDYAYPCDAKVEMPSLPESITRYYEFRWPFPRKAMGPHDGTNCPLWSQFVSES